MKTLAEFETFYGTELRPTLEIFEGHRKKIRNILVITIVAALATAGVLFLLFQQEGPGIAAIPLVVGGIVVALVWWLKVRSFVADFKCGVIAPIVEFCDPHLSYFPQRGIGQHQFEGAGLFKHRIDRYRCEDLVKGALGSTALEFSEVHAEYKTETRDSKGHRQTHWHTIFQGLLFVADFNKHFQGRTFVLPDTAERLLGFLGKSLQSIFKHEGELVKLEDPEFEKLFVVYGSDQVEARYILSTSLMSRITEFRKKSGTHIYLSFVASSVNVAVSITRDLFEPRLFRTLLDFSIARQYLEDLQFAMSIVDDLNLNTRIWTKE